MLDVVALAIQCGIVVAEPAILEAIVRVESRGNPYALNVNGEMELVRQPGSLEEAIAMARWLEEHGYNWDAGLGQVNSANLGRLGLDAKVVFDPCANLRAASQVLEECYERAARRFGEGERAMTAALSCYNTGHFTRGVANGYVRAVRGAAARPLAMGRAGRGGSVVGEKRKNAETSREEVRHPEEAFAKAAEDVFGQARRVGQR